MTFLQSVTGAEPQVCLTNDVSNIVQNCFSTFNGLNIHSIHFCVQRLVIAIAFVIRRKMVRKTLVYCDDCALIRVIEAFRSLRPITTKTYTIFLLISLIKFRLETVVLTFGQAVSTESVLQTRLLTGSHVASVESLVRWMRPKAVSGSGVFVLILITKLFSTKTYCNRQQKYRLFDYFTADRR